MISAVLQFLLGWVFDLLPVELSATSRRRHFERGDRVLLRARIEGASPGYWDWIAVEKRQLWLIANKGLPNETSRLISFDDVTSIDIVSSTRAAADRHVDVVKRTSNLRIYCPMDWQTLEMAASDWGRLEVDGQ